MDEWKKSQEKSDRYERFFKIGFAVAVIVTLSTWCGIGYVVWHFIEKWW